MKVECSLLQYLSLFFAIFATLPQPQLPLTLISNVNVWRVLI